jgi:hypothetical protein
MTARSYSYLPELTRHEQPGVFWRAKRGWDFDMFAPPSAGWAGAHKQLAHTFISLQ